MSINNNVTKIAEIFLKIQSKNVYQLYREKCSSIYIYQFLNYNKKNNIDFV